MPPAAASCHPHGAAAATRAGDPVSVLPRGGAGGSLHRAAANRCALGRGIPLRRAADLGRGRLALGRPLALGGRLLGSRGGGSRGGVSGGLGGLGGELGRARRVILRETALLVLVPGTAVAQVVS